MGIEAEEREHNVGSFWLSIHKHDGTDFEPKRIISFFYMVTDTNFKYPAQFSLPIAKKDSKPEASEPIRPSEEQFPAKMHWIWKSKSVTN